MFNEMLLNEVKNKVLSKLTSSGQYNTEIFGMQFFRESEPNKINRCFHTPFIILMLNGEKHSIFGSEEFIYGAGKYVITSVDYPVSSFVTNISEENPYVSILLPVNNKIVFDIISKEVVADKCFCGISIADVTVKTYVRKKSDTPKQMNNLRYFDYMDFEKQTISNARDIGLGDGSPEKEPYYTYGVVNYN